MKRFDVLIAVVVALSLLAFILARSPSKASGATSLDPRGQTAPDFRLASLDGHAVRLSDFRGSAVVVNFWATWCQPCRIEMPWFVELQKQYASQGLHVIGIAVGDSSKKEIEQFAGKMGVNYPILLGNESVADSYGGLQFLPATFYIDREGRIVDRVFGLKGRDEIEAEFQRALK